MLISSARNSGVILLPSFLAMHAPPQPAGEQRTVGEDREQRPARRRRTDKEEHQELGDVAEEQRTEHPARGSDAGVQQPAVRLAPLAHVLSAEPELRGAKLAVDQHPKAATPWPRPE